MKNADGACADRVYHARIVISDLCKGTFDVTIKAGDQSTQTKMAGGSKREISCGEVYDRCIGIEVSAIKKEELMDVKSKILSNDNDIKTPTYMGRKMTKAEIKYINEEKYKCKNNPPQKFKCPISKHLDALQMEFCRKEKDAAEKKCKSLSNNDYDQAGKYLILQRNITSESVAYSLKATDRKVKKINDEFAKRDAYRSSLEYKSNEVMSPCVVYKTGYRIPECYDSNR